MSATVTAIRADLPPVTRLIPVTELDRGKRLKALVELAADHLIGVPPSAVRTEVEVRMLAHWTLTPARAMEAWRDFLAEEDDLNAVEANEPEFRDLQPGLKQQDRDAALSDLLDGTTTYHGDRRRPALRDLVRGTENSNGGN
jgi:hypothetical protein